MIELEERKLEVKFKGIIYKMDYPTVSKAIELEEEFEKGDKKDNEIMINYFIDLGLPKAVVTKLEDYQFSIIMKEFQKPKK